MNEVSGAPTQESDPLEMPPVLQPFASLGELDAEHHRLLEQQHEVDDDQQLTRESGELVAKGRPLGITLADPVARRDCQGILNYWAIFHHRSGGRRIQADLLPYDANSAPELAESLFPYTVRQLCNRCYESLGWRRLLDQCEHDLAGDRLLLVVDDIADEGRALIQQMLLPRLRQGQARRPDLALSEHWRYYDVALGESPVRNLLLGVARGQGHDAQWFSMKEAECRRDGATLSGILQADPHRPAVVILDDLASLFRCSDEDRHAVVENLGCFLNLPSKKAKHQPQASPNYLIVRLRRDQIVLLAKLEHLEEPLRNDRVSVAFTTAELRDFIVIPAREIGLIFEPGVVDQMLVDIQGEPAPLSLLHFTLWRLWQLRDKNQITREAYRQAGAGKTALSKAMDETWAELPTERHEALKKILLAMVHLEPEGIFVTADVSREDLYRVCGDQRAVDDVVDLLTKKGLVRRCETEDGSAQQEPLTLAHPALLTAWPRFIHWQEDFRTESRFRSRLRRQRRMQLITMVVGILALAGVVGADRYQDYLIRQQQRLGYAVDSSAGGDPSGALLWLQERNGILNRLGLGADDREAMVRQLATMQTPTLAYRKADSFGDDSAGGASATAPASKTPSVSPEGLPSLGNIALSSDGRHFGVVHYNKVSDPSKRGLSVEVFDVTNGASWLNASVNLQLSETDAGSPENVGGSIAFISSIGAGEGDRSTYLFTAGDDLRAWTPGKTGFDILNIQNIDAVRNAVPEEQISGVAVGGNAKLVTLYRRRGGTAGAYRARLWRIDVRGPGMVELLPVLVPGLDGIPVSQIVASPAGDLLALLEDKQAKGSSLMVWRRSKEGSPQLTKTPPWIESLVDRNSTRLNSWGWKPNEHRDGWVRLSSRIRAASFSSDGNRFATACEDGQVLIWNVDLRDESSSTVTPLIETELNLGSRVDGLAFLDDRTIATGGRDRTVRIWDIHTGVEILPRAFHEATVNELVFAKPDVVITRTQKILRTWRYPQLAQLMDGTQVETAGYARPEILADLARSRRHFSSEESSDAGAGTGTPSAESRVSTTVGSHGQWQLSTTSSSKDDRLQIELRHASAQEPTFTGEITLAGERPVIASSSSGSWLAAVVAEASKQGALELLLWDLANPAQADVEPQRIPIKSPAGEGSLRINDIAFARVDHRDVIALGGMEVRGSEKVGTLLIGLPERGAQGLVLRRVVDKASASIAHQEEILCVSFSGDGRLLATGSVDNHAKLWQTRDFISPLAANKAFAVNARRLVHSTDVQQLAFAPTAHRKAAARLASVTSEGEAAVWSATDAPVSDNADFKVRHEARIRSVSFSPDGGWIVTGGDDCKCRIWSSLDGKPVGMFPHRAPVTEAWMLEDGGILTVTSSQPASGEDRSASGAQPRAVGELHYWDAKRNYFMPGEPSLQEQAARQIRDMTIDFLPAADFLQRAPASSRN